MSEWREYRKTVTVKAREATTGGVIHTLEGDHTYVAGDFICRGIEGEEWPVKRSIFLATYEPLKEEKARALWRIEKELTE